VTDTYLTDPHVVGYQRVLPEGEAAAHPLE